MGKEILPEAAWGGRDGDLDQGEVMRAAGTPVAVALFLSMVLSGAASAAERDPDLEVLRRTEDAFVRISRQVTPSVVNIRTYSRASTRSFDLSDQFYRDLLDPFREFFGQDFADRFGRKPNDRRVQTGLGSGVIVRSEGIVLTNNHVISGAEEIMVTLDDRSEVKAQVVGSDPRTDIAVLRLPKGDYRAAALGDSDHLQVGEWVVAIGNPFGLDQSVTVGVVSAKGRANVGVADLEDFIQTDAAINPGNSGGPLIDLDGHVVGINTAIFSRSGGYQGIGFAIPSNMALIVMEGILRTGRIVRSDLGVRIQEADEALLEAIGANRFKGVLVSEVVPGGVADKAGLRRGDLVTRIRDRDTPDPVTFYRLAGLLPVGDEIPLVVVRNSLPQTVMVRVSELPSRPQESPVRLRTALGFSVEELTEELADRLGYRYERGVLVTRVGRAGPADRAGVEPGDLITAVNGIRTPDLETFRSNFEAVEWGERVKLDLRRGAQSFKAELVLEQGR